MWLKLDKLEPLFLFRRPMSSLTESPAWVALRDHAEAIRGLRIAGLFAEDAQRAERFAAAGGGLHLDYSKQLLDDRARELLLALARQQDLPGWIARMFAGEAINHSENRAVLHTA